MSLSWNEIKDRAVKFSKEWETAKREEADAKSFWDDFFNVFGVNRRRVATFEYKVPRETRSDGFIDLLWKGVLLVEHKLSGKNLDAAHKQAVDYFPGLKDHELPKFICVCNFQEFRLKDLDEGTEFRFPLSDLVNNVQYFGFLAGYQKRTFKDQEPINIEAAYRMGKLHDELKNFGYKGHVFEVYLVRMLFCLFAEDTTIFEKAWFSYYIQNKTKEDGTDLGSQLAHLFQILNTPIADRSKILDDDLNIFPYVNGRLFEEVLPVANFNSKMRDLVLNCAELDWSLISPAIFGSLFQSTMNPVERRNLGAHYTSEKNIMKVIKPLFLEALNEEFNSIKNNKPKLKEFHRKIASLKFLDPACGCGNFLVISYRELRMLELEILKILQERDQLALSIDDLVLLTLDQFYGIEIDEWPCRIAEVAMWLMEHQMNMKMSEALGQYYVRLPLDKSANIINGNALQIDWQSILNPINTYDIVTKHANIYLVNEPAVEYNAVNVQTETMKIYKGEKPEPEPEKEFDFIFGNPPFSGSKIMSQKQRDEIKEVFNNAKGSGVLDYVSGWYIKASKYVNSTNRRTKCAFVSTNSIIQGEQVGILWNELMTKYKIKIHFAHKTFKWSNEARGVAAVYCVIIGFSKFDTDEKYIFEYDDIKGEPQSVKAFNINPYLVDAKDIVIRSRQNPINQVPYMSFGNMPLDGGNLLLSDEEMHNLIVKEPLSKKYIKELLSAFEFLNGKKRWCLWLVDANPSELKAMPLVMERIKKVQIFREKSIAPSTRRFAITPTLFRDRNNPASFILLPRVSSENRKYIPIGFFDNQFIPSDTCMTLPDATIYHFGVLTSEMHMAWVRYTCGRLKSDFRYSKDIVYNNFPWAENPSEKQVESVESSAKLVLEIREKYLNPIEGKPATLADLYDQLAMPPDLVKAHSALDKAVDQCYRSQPFPNEAKRMEYLFELYEKYTAGMFTEEKKGKKLSRKNC